MGEPFAYALLGADVDIPCPQCGYPVWIRLVEAVVQTAVRCPACRARIWLVDDRGSVRNAAQDIQRAIGELFS